ncbi:S-layer homology domain-containing protein [Paenibacillus glufosinatiresistens]|uniref:S-layer homology domain-containing protein n=1 Tax=Paenibacillus glufosinatiresistens TaxID=3070657 RepID=UPI00286DC32F|nr:S-layer homology domain-containing protein [Paenibacillus sp. YX.27]
MMRKLVFSIAAFILSFSSIATTVFADLPSYGEEWQNAEATQQSVNFSDLPHTNWAYQYIAEMVNRKVISGYPDGKFRPNNTITRAEFAKIMISASGIDAKKVNYSSFADVSATNWASPFVEAVKDYMTGYRTANGQYVFNPGQPALREDITVALVKLKGYATSRLPDHSTLEAMFKDYKGISESAKDYVAIAIENGLVSGYQDETFRPQATVTRAEAAVLLWRAYQYGNDNKDVGGGSEDITTPVSPSPTPSLNNQTPSTPVPSQKPGQSDKFTVDTLVGGTGAGNTDGPVSQAKISYIDSMVLDKSDNIYFLNSQNKSIRKFTSANGTVSTLNTSDNKPDDLYPLNDRENRKQQLLAYNYQADKVLVGSIYLSGGNFSATADTRLHQVQPSVDLFAYGNDDGFEYQSYLSFVQAIREDEVLYGIVSRDDNNKVLDSYILQAKKGEQSKIIASTKEGSSSAFSGKSAIVYNDQAIYILDAGTRTLNAIQLFPRKIKVIKTINTFEMESITSYNGKFYFSSGDTVYEMDTAGNLNYFVRGTDLIYNDGNPIESINEIAFDKAGNIILFDAGNHSIRRINL